MKLFSSLHVFIFAKQLLNVVKIFFFPLCHLWTVSTMVPHAPARKLSGNATIRLPARHHDHNLHFKAIHSYFPTFLHYSTILVSCGHLPLITSMHEKSIGSILTCYFDLGKQGCMKDGEIPGLLSHHLQFKAT